uniref:Uncharacterized protein n=1 Tax=Scleropages formosus TaxID=113540 RepID=A0A8C9SJD8_SCLFO
MRPRNPPVCTDSKKPRKVMNLDQKVELLDKLCFGTSVAATGCYYREIHASIAAATPTTSKHLHKPQDPGLSHAETATFLWGQDCYIKGIPVEFLN